VEGKKPDGKKRRGQLTEVSSKKMCIGSPRKKGAKGKDSQGKNLLNELREEASREEGHSPRGKSKKRIR